MSGENSEGSGVKSAQAGRPAPLARLLVDSALYPELRRRLAESPESVFEDYNLAAEERELLRHPDHRLLPLIGAAIQRSQSEPPAPRPIHIAVDSRMLPDVQMALTVVPCQIGERISFAAWISPLPEGADPSRLPPPPGSTLPGNPLTPLYAVIHLTAAHGNDGSVSMWASFLQNSNVVTTEPRPEASGSPELADAVRAAAPEERYDKLLDLLRAIRGGETA